MKQKLDAIVYTSNTGFTARYAALLGEQTGLPVYELSSGTAPKGARVLYLGWLQAGTVKGLKKARGRYAVKAVCPVGMAAEPNGTVPENLPTFYLRGGYRPEQMKGIYKYMMGMMTKMVLKAPAENDEQREQQQAFLSGGDWVSTAQLAPVLAWLEG